MMKIQTQVQVRSRLVPVLAVLAGLMQLIDPFPVWTAVLVGLGGAWLAGYLWARALAGGLELRREMRFGWAQVGDQLEERFTLRNRSWLPALWVEILDESDLPGYQASRVSSLGGVSSSQWRTAGVCNQRGVFTLGPTSLIASDPLGLYRVTIHDPASTTLVVMPPVLSLPEIVVAPGGRSGEGRPRVNAPERTVSAASVRAYVPGDSLRLVHWPTTARREEFFVRLLDGTPASDWWVFLDLDRQVQAGQGWDSTTEHGVILAASLANAGLAGGQAVGFAASSQSPIWLAPREGEGQRWEILRALARAAPGDLPLVDLLARSRRAIDQRTSLVIITPNLQPDWAAALIPLLWRGIVPTVVLFDPHSFEPGRPAGEARSLERTLARLGIRHFTLNRETLDRPEARPGRQGRQEFRITPFGRAIPREPAAETPWEKLV